MQYKPFMTFLGLVYSHISGKDENNAIIIKLIYCYIDQTGMRVLPGDMDS